MTERFKLGYVCGDFGLIDNAQSKGNRWTDLHSMSENSEKNVQICINKMNELAEENEQLKQRNDNQYKQLQHLWSLMESKDWDTLTNMVEQMKKDEEQLQKEWGTYGDVE